MTRLFAALAAGAAFAAPAAASPSHVFHVGHVTDGDTIALTNGARVRLVQIDTPEVYFGVECFGHAASAALGRMLPAGTAVRLVADPALDRIDRYGRLLRYVVRVRDGVDLNVALVRAGIAAPYFFDGDRGRYASLLTRLALRARARHLGLWGAGPGTPVDFERGVDTGPAG
jgi:endonuclease YncB( thermonuclease family)